MTESDEMGMVSWPQGHPKCLLSACIIARDAESTIGQVIKSLSECADEVCLVLDDRTADGTMDAVSPAVVACMEKNPLFGFHLTRRPWTHNFSAARNASIDMANGEYVLILDADDVLAPGDGALIREALKAQKGADCPIDLFTCPSFLKPSYGAPNYFEEGFGQCGIQVRNRIFRKATGARYLTRGGRPRRVHEQLLFPGDAPMREDFLQARFYHLGEMTRDKHDYYWSLLTLDHMDDPTDPIPAIMLADRHLTARDAARAARLLKCVDIDVVGAAGTRARYWIAKGKVCQLAYMKALVEDGSRKVAIAEEALACYQRAATEHPIESEGALHAAIIAFVGLYAPEKATAILAECLERDPSCVCASEMLDLYRAYGKNYEGFLHRLGHYLAHMGDIEQRAALQAEGYAPDVATANGQQLSEILSTGGAQAPGRIATGKILALTDLKIGDR